MNNHMLNDCSMYKRMDQEEDDNMDKVDSRYVVGEKEAAGKSLRIAWLQGPSTFPPA